MLAGLYQLPDSNIRTRVDVRSDHRYDVTYFHGVDVFAQRIFALDEIARTVVAKSWLPIDNWLGGSWVGGGSVAVVRDGKIKQGRKHAVQNS